MFIIFIYKSISLLYWVSYIKFLFVLISYKLIFIDMFEYEYVSIRSISVNKIDIWPKSKI